MSIARIVCMTIGFALSTSLAAANSQPLLSKDLAIAMPITSKDLPKGTQLLPRAWFETLHQAFSQTSVGPALETESPYQDWQIVSLRIAPCAPQGLTPRDADENCWPEIRLVWQPIQRKIRLHERYMEAAADDRAVHAIYAVDPIAAPTAAARLQVLQELRTAVLQLRDPSIDARAYRGFGLRPEADDSLQFKAFSQRLMAFLSRYTQPSRLRSLTAFSLPEGREPAHLDEWVFLSFSAVNGQLKSDSIRVRSAVDGRVLADLGPVIRGSQNRDEDSFYDLLNGSNDARELEASVMLRVNDIARLTPKVKDRQQLLVANTSCVSCHKMNELRFDFHNFSYLEDRELTISPRVQRDVELDLIWLQKSGL